MDELTNEQLERFNKFWDKEYVDGLLNSNIPRHHFEHGLIQILSLEDDIEFFQKSFEAGLLKTKRKFISVDIFNLCKSAFNAGAMHCATEGKIYPQSDSFGEWVIKNF